MAEAGKYGIVYADPPWRYDMKRGNGVAEKHYPTMSMEEICALPVADLAAKDSALFLWATFPQLNEAPPALAASPSKPNRSTGKSIP